jgi:hypothetical protein
LGVNSGVGDTLVLFTRLSSGFVQDYEAGRTTEDSGCLHMTNAEEGQQPRRAVVIRPEDAAEYLAHMDIRVVDVMMAI